MERIRRETLILVRDQLAAHPWTDDEIAELVAPSMGIISGLPELMLELDELRRLDLGAIAPASDLPVDE